MGGASSSNPSPSPPSLSSPKEGVSNNRGTVSDPKGAGVDAEQRRQVAVSESDRTIGSTLSGIGLSVDGRVVPRVDLDP